MFKELFTESDQIKVQTSKGYVNFDKSEIKDMIDNADLGGDNLPKWLYQAVIMSPLKTPIKGFKKGKAVVINILQALYDGEYNKVDFKREDGSIVGLGNIKVSDYIKGK